MNLQETIAAIPYLPIHKVTVVIGKDGKTIARMPFRREITNYINTVHAGALFTLAETAAGVAANAIVPDGKAFALLRSASVGYTRRAESDLVATADITDADTDRARRNFEADGKADADVSVSIADAVGEQVFKAIFDYALRQVKS